MKKMSNESRYRETLIQGLALALDICSTLNRNGVRWGNPSPFQDRIDDLLLRAGRTHGSDAATAALLDDVSLDK